MTGIVTCEIDQTLAIVTFDNGTRLNAIDQAIAGGLARLTGELADNDGVNAIVIRGAGLKAFSAGVDLKAADATGDREAAFAGIDRAMQEVERNFTRIEVPTISMLSGVCYGGGVHLASLSDFRVAASDVKLSVPAIANRLFYPVSALERLGQIIGWGNARRLIYGGAPVDAGSLAHWGFIDQLAEPAHVESETIAFARRLADKPREIMIEYRRMFAALENGEREAAERLRAAARSREQARRRAVG